LGVHTQFLPAQGLRIRVETEENGLVNKRVLLLCPGPLLDLLSSGTNDGLDLTAVDKTSDIGIGDFGRRKTEEI
jgi:hypothetical protein